MAYGRTAVGDDVAAAATSSQWLSHLRYEYMVQVAAEAFSRQPPAARPRPVRRRPTLDSKQPKLPAAPRAEVHPPQQQQVR